MIKIRCLAFIAVAFCAATAGAGGLPAEVSEKLENTISFDESDGFAGSYRITISSLIQKPNGKGRKQSVIEAEVASNRDGTIERRLLKYLEDGSDVTEKKRTKFESGDGGRRGDDDDDLIEPFGATADVYRFSVPERRGPAMVTRFEPAPGHEDDDNIARGEIAWDDSSLDPLWLEMVAVDPPSPLQKLEFRMEYARIDDDFFLSRLESDGLAKIVLIKREFHMEIRFENIQPSTEVAD